MSLNQLKRAINSIKPLPPVTICYFIKSKGKAIAFKENQPLRSASIIKLFILAAAYYEEEQETINLSEQVDIPLSDMAGGSGIISYLSDQHIYTYQQLLELMVIVSDNTATNALIDFVGLNKIQAFIEKIGCKNTKLERKLMDEKAQQLGLENVTTCYDVMLLLDLFTEQNKFLSKHRQQQILTILENQQFNSKLTAFSSYDSEIRTFHKTGELTGAEHDATLFQTDNQLLKAVMLTEGWTNNGTGQQFHQAVGANIYRYLKE